MHRLPSTTAAAFRFTLTPAQLSRVNLCRRAGIAWSAGPGTGGYFVNSMSKRFTVSTLSAALFCIAASAQTAQYTLTGEGGERLLTLNTTSLDEIPYVPLQALIEQAGGSFNALPARLRVDLGGSTAWLRTGESRVYALSIFSLRHPIRDQHGVPLIAASDVPDFFLKSFRTTVRTVEAETPTQITTTPDATVSPTAVPPTRVLKPMDEPDALEQLGELSSTPASISRIVIDPGHGGYDTGVQAGDGLSEESVTLSVAERLKSLLTTDGRFVTVLTREEDADMSFPQRANAAGAVPGTLLISLHAGSSLSPATEGVAVFYPTPATAAATGTTSVTATLLGVDHRLLVEGRKFADALAASLGASAAVPLRGVMEVPLRMQSDMNILTAQIELGCLTNPADAQRLASEGYLARLASGIFDGIVAYVDGEQPASAATPADTPPAPVEN